MNPGLTRPSSTAQVAGTALRVLGVAAIVVVFAYVVASHSVDSPKLALALPALLISAAVCSRWPAAAVGTVLFVTAFSGTLSSIVGFPVLRTINLILAGLWIGVIWGFLAGGRRQATWIWPGVVACAIYIGLTFLEIFTASSLSLGMKSFETSAWYMLVFLLIGYAQWRRETEVRIGRALVVAGIAVGAYAVLRKIIGPSHAEQQNALDVAGFGSPLQQSDVSQRVGTDLSPIRFFGSFSTSEGLAAFGSMTMIASLSFALLWTRRWRLVAWLSVGLSAFAVLASGTRAGFLAAAGGCLVVLALFQLSQGTRRFGASLVAVVAVLLVGGIAFSITTGSGDSTKRYTRIFSPGTDPSYQARLTRWRIAFNQAERHPFGQGLGTAGSLAAQDARVPNIGAIIDNSYLKIALEQGIPVMVFFGGSLLLLLFGLGQRTVYSEDPTVAGFGAAAAGAVTGLLVLFYFGQYNEDVASLAGWVIVGLGVAQYATLPDAQRNAAADWGRFSRRGSDQPALDTPAPAHSSR